MKLNYGCRPIYYVKSSIIDVPMNIQMLMKYQVDGIPLKSIKYQVGELLNSIKLMENMHVSNIIIHYTGMILI